MKPRLLPLAVLIRRSTETGKLIFYAPLVLFRYEAAYPFLLKSEEEAAELLANHPFAASVEPFAFDSGGFGL